MVHASWKRTLGALSIIIALVLLGVKSRPLRRRIAHFLQKFRRCVCRIIAGRGRLPRTGLLALPVATENDAADGQATDGERPGLLHDVEGVSSSFEGTTDPSEHRSTPPKRQVTANERGARTPEALANAGEEQDRQSRADAPAIAIGSPVPRPQASSVSSSKMTKFPPNQPGSKSHSSTCKPPPGKRPVLAEAGRGEVEEPEKPRTAEGTGEHGDHVKHRPRSFFERFPYFIPSSSENSDGNRSDSRPLGTRPETGGSCGALAILRKGNKAISASASLHEALCDLSILIQGTEPSTSTEPVNTSIPFCFSFPSLTSAMHSSTDLDTPRFSGDGPLGRDEEDREQRGGREGTVRASDSLPSFSSSSRDGGHLLNSGKRRRSLAERFPRAFAARAGSFHGDGRQGSALRWVIASRGEAQEDLRRRRLGASSLNTPETNSATDKSTVPSSVGGERWAQGKETQNDRRSSSTASSSSESASSSSSACTPSSSRPLSQPRASAFAPPPASRPAIVFTFLPARVRSHPERVFSSLLSSSALLVRKWVRALFRGRWPLNRLFPEAGGSAFGEESPERCGDETGKKQTIRHREQREERGRGEDSQASLTALSGREMAAKMREASLCQQFLRLLRLALPKEKLCSSEGFYLVVLLSTLISRTFLSIWIASVNGRVVEGIIRQDGKKFLRGLGLLVAYAVPAALVNAAIQFSEKSLGVLLRKNLTDTLVKKYLTGLTFYQMVALDARVNHPDELLANTTASFCMLVASLFSSFLKPTVDIVFLTRSILRHLGVKAPLFLGLWYLLTAGVLHWASPPIGKKTARMHELDAKYRALHSDLLQHSEEIAFYGGGKPAALRLQRAFDAACVYRQHIFFIYHLLMGTLDMLFAKHMSVVMGYAVVALPAFREKLEALLSRRSEPPALLDMTDYVEVFTAAEHAKKIRQKRFSDEMQSRGLLARIPSRGDKKEDIAHAYVRNSTLLINLAKAVGRIVLAYKEVQQLGGYTERLYEFLQVVEDLQRGVYCPTVALNQESKGREAHILASTGRLVTESNSKTVEFRNVAVVTPGGHVLLQNLSFAIQTGKNVFLLGPNGCGKTSLFRILGGLWPLVEGEVRKPKASKLFYIPQRPYMPEGTLRDQVIYPMAYEDYMQREAENDEQLEVLLRLVGLGHLLERFPEKWETWRDWHDVLSGGEKQRMAFARLFFHQPVFAILDEATSAVSVDMESTLYRLCRERHITLITISHNLSLLKYHESLLRISPATAEDGHGPAGQQWSFEPTEGLRRLDSYSFLLNVADDTDAPSRNARLREKKREGRYSPAEARARVRGRALRERRCEVGSIEHGDTAEGGGWIERLSELASESEGRRGSEREVEARGQPPEERRSDREEDDTPATRPRKQRLRRGNTRSTRQVLAPVHAGASYEASPSASSSSGRYPEAIEIQAGGSVSPVETDGPSHTPEVGVCGTEGECEGWSPCGESAREERRKETRSREALLIEADADGDAVVVIQESVSDLEEEELVRACFFRLPRSAAGSDLSHSPEVLSRRTTRYLAGTEGADLPQANANGSTQPETWPTVEGNRDAQRLSETAHPSFKSIEAEPTSDRGFWGVPNAPEVSPLLLAAAQIVAETDFSVVKSGETGGADEVGTARKSSEERQARLFPPFFTTAPSCSSSTPPCRGDSVCTRRRHSGPAEGRLPLSAARIGAAAAEATVMCLKQAREKQKKLEEGGHNVSWKGDQCHPDRRNA
ncbi:hypothetical protein NCLIV_057400 [Neospora caninum Liverpool]|uniref:ABC transporter, ATP-binding domain-containing protein n=1 Tax=Neospora caninum (strain Liverpool) TaxID=572307 RepID=F0VNM1_NEOCL|nr:hypothetical protein NCLIV_057400 [Neospora caninum Liverpool]CBZ55317.1 hypothetical protein NCLIV_057400 [Neospora caninum Liverpool]CEL70049.1 TPA: ABC transporter, ATP-binding domain-containing protein [Neospora caninum Liverpool]|eukprot:XP_003885345.1 hypothetical protein NCLIV_057400 [Neospora caninum Liverpool]